MEQQSSLFVNDRRFVKKVIFIRLCIDKPVCAEPHTDVRVDIIRYTYQANSESVVFELFLMVYELACMLTKIRPDKLSIDLFVGPRCSI